MHIIINTNLVSKKSWPSSQVSWFQSFSASVSFNHRHQVAHLIVLLNRGLPWSLFLPGSASSMSSWTLILCKSILKVFCCAICCILMAHHVLPAVPFFFTAAICSDWSEDYFVRGDHCISTGPSCFQGFMLMLLRNVCFRPWFSFQYAG